jgi:CRP-like cAMP-binding protein
VVIRVFRELAAQGKTILIVTHDPSLTSRTDRTIIISDGEFIDPTVASVLPSLDHPQMLQATHELEKRVFEAGETIIRQGEAVNYFYMVADGKVAVTDGGSDTAVASLEKGQFFGEVELVRNESAIASVRADGSPVELAMIPKEHFHQIMEVSPETIDLLKKVASDRWEENLARSGQEVSL